MKVEVAVLGSPSLISLMVSVDVKQHCNENAMGIIMYPAFSRMPALKVTVGDSGLCQCFLVVCFTWSEHVTLARFPSLSSVSDKIIQWFCCCCFSSVRDGCKLQALVYDVLPSRKVPESEARSV